MIEKHLLFDLPSPWVEKRFEVRRLGSINYLVGPNGSGKSRFAETLKSQLQKVRHLGTDRLRGMEKNQGMGFLGDSFAQGVQKNWFQHLKNAGVTYGFGMDTLVILEERIDIRVRIEATLSHLFGRKILLEWDSGFLLPKAILARTGSSYRLDIDECHGIKELLVLLTHVYHDACDYLIIDEPELHLHPQYQSFLMQEIRKLAGDPSDGSGKKVFFLITHSPFILDLNSIEDLQSVISFDLQHLIPRHCLELEQNIVTRLSSLVPRLNASHRQLFFSDNPVFVEGILDAQIVQIIQKARGVSIAGAGSCIIDCGGCEEVNKYLELCMAFGKRAYFLYDLDSLFSGNLRSCIRADGTIASFLATLGIGSDFTRYCGELDRKLTEVVKQIRNCSNPPSSLEALRAYLDGLANGNELSGDKLARARVALLIQINRDRGAVSSVSLEDQLGDIEGRINQIVNILQAKNVFLLPGGALEHYLPSYAGDLFVLTDEAKKNAVDTETSLLEQGITEAEMSTRYGALFNAIAAFPGKKPVDIDATLSEYLSDYIHEIQGLVVTQLTWGLDEIRSHLSIIRKGIDQLFTFAEFSRESDNRFVGKILIADSYGQGSRFVRISHRTNAGMRDFNIETE